MEMGAVADIFDQDGDGYIDYKEFVQALRPDRTEVRLTDLDNIKHTLKYLKMVTYVVI